MHSDRCSEHHACAGVYVKQVLCASAYICVCAHALMYVQFVHLALGNEDEGVQLVYESTCCLAWGIIFDRRKDRGVICVFSIFKWVGVYVGVRTHTHTHFTDGVLGC